MISYFSALFSGAQPCNCSKQMHLLPFVLQWVGREPASWGRPPSFLSYFSGMRLCLVRLFRLTTCGNKFHQSSSIIINHHWSSSIIIHHHQSSAIITNQRHSSPITTNHQSSQITRAYRDTPAYHDTPAVAREHQTYQTHRVSNR